MKSCLLAYAAACTCVFLTPPVFAQGPSRTPAVEVSAGYQLLFATGDPGATFPVGLAVDLTVNSGSSGLIAEGGWSRRSEAHGPDEVRFDFWHAGAGFRWTSRTHPRIWPYAQGLIGAAFHDISGEVLGADQSDTNAYWMVQPGGGVNFVVGEKFRIFGAVDYRRVFLVKATDGESGLNEFRVFVGARLTLR